MQYKFEMLHPPCALAVTRRERDRQQIFTTSVAHVQRAAASAFDTRHQRRKAVRNLACGIVIQMPVHAFVAEEDRAPVPMDLRCPAGAATATQRAHTPRMVAHPKHTFVLEIDAPAFDLDIARPATELRIAGEIDRGPWPVGHGLATFIDSASHGIKTQLRDESPLPVVDQQTQAAHRINYLNLNRPDRGIATFGRRTSAREQRVLRTLEAHAESSVGDIAIRIEAEGAAEYERTVFDKTLEEVAIVGIGVGGADVGQRLGRLVNEIVVEAGDHGGSASC